jgi:ubiquinone/menaquinone biosynthesis C-methylase UbiE
VGRPLAEESKAKVVAVYDAAAPTYNRIGPSFFLHFGRRLVDHIQIVPGARVLDVATGTGAVLIPAAEVIGDSGQVIGIDLSPRMIDRARGEIHQSGFRNAEVLVADAETLPFPNESFDLVLCSFAIFLFSNLELSLAEFHRVLRSAGRVGFVYSAGEDANWSWHEKLISKYQPTVSLDTERYSPEQVEAALQQVGFINPSTRIESHCLVFTDASEFWGWARSHGDRTVLESLRKNRSEFKRELFEEFGKRAEANGIPYRVFAVLTVAAKS